MTRLKSAGTTFRVIGDVKVSRVEGFKTIKSKIFYDVVGKTKTSNVKEALNNMVTRAIVAFINQDERASSSSRFEARILNYETTEERPSRVSKNSFYVSNGKLYSIAHDSKGRIITRTRVEVRDAEVTFEKWGSVGIVAIKRDSKGRFKSWVKADDFEDIPFTTGYSTRGIQRE